MLGFWDWIRRKKANEEHEIKNIRTVGDIMITTTEADFKGTRIIAVSAWNGQMAEELYQRVRATLKDEDE